jgi:4-amino-4-deoxy-L-arabinose transferase-like glycosyltransferase
LLLFLWMCFVVRGLFYVLSTPVWEGFDEYSHFAYLEHVASRWGLITDRDTVPQDITESLDVLPLPRAMQPQLQDGKPRLDYESYWALSPAERANLAARLHAIRPATQERLESRWLFIYEKQQPPLYYWMMSPLYWICRDWPLVDRVMLIRIAGMLLGSLVVPATYFLVVPLADARWALGAAALAVSMPGLVMAVSRTGNECMAVAVGSALVLAAAKLARSGTEEREPANKSAWLVGLALSAGLLTKAYFLSCVAMLALWMLWRITRKAPLVAIAKQACAVFGLPLILAGWWYVRNLLQTGSVSGEQTDAAMQQMPWSARLAALAGVRWWRALDTLFFSHIFIGGWSFLTVRSWMYHVLGALFAMAIVGVVIALVSGRSGLRGNHVPADVRRSLSMLTLLEAGLLVSLAYHTLVMFAVLHESATNGWYLYSLAAAECLLVPWGLAFWLGERWKATVFPVLAALFAALDLFAMHVYLLPYYTGLTALSPQGIVRGWNLWRPSPDDWGTLFARLTVNKPEPLSTALLIGLWAMYLTATLAAPGMAWFATRGMEEKAATR